MFGGGRTATYLLFKFKGVLYQFIIIHHYFIYILGASEMLMAHAASELAAKTPGKEAVAIESFAKALRQVYSVVRSVARLDLNRQS